MQQYYKTVRVDDIDEIQEIDEIDEIDELINMSLANNINEIPQSLELDDIDIKTEVSHQYDIAEIYRRMEVLEKKKTETKILDLSDLDDISVEENDPFNTMMKNIRLEMNYQKYKKGKMSKFEAGQISKFENLQSILHNIKLIKYAINENFACAPIQIENDDCKINIKLPSEYPLIKKVLNINSVIDKVFPERDENEPIILYLSVKCPMNDIDYFETSIFCKINNVSKSLKIKELGYDNIPLFSNIDEITDEVVRLLQIIFNKTF